jgi:hypothetical protein
MRSWDPGVVGSRQRHLSENLLGYAPGPKLRRGLPLSPAEPRRGESSAAARPSNRHRPSVGERSSTIVAARNDFYLTH